MNSTHSACFFQRRHSSAFILTVTLSLALGACSGGPEIPGDWRAAERARIAGMVTDNPAEAWEAAIAAAFKEADGAAKAEWEGLAKDAAAGIAGAYRVALEDASADPSKVLGLLQSLRALAPEPLAAGLFDGLDLGLGVESKLVLDRAERFWVERKEAAAFAVFLEALDLGLRDRKLVGTWAARALEGKNRAALRRLALVDARLLSTEQAAYAAGSDPIAELLKGTVTIWVNRGIRMERGLGMPDRVIGSGFFIDRSGYLLTNYHVIASEVDPEYEGFSRLSVRLPGSSELRVPAKVIGWDRVFDLALLKVDTTPEFVHSFSGRARFAPGDRIYAIGSPVGLESTVSAGIVSATGRRFLELGDAVQVDVSVNPGNSGGPLLDEKGELAGIIFAGMPQFQGLNFAVPARWVVANLSALYDGGEVTHAWTGLSFHEDPAPPELVYRHPGGTSALEAGDRLLGVNGVPARALVDAQASLLGLKPGTLARVAYRRGEREGSALVALRKRPARPVDDALERDRKENLYPLLFGMALSPRSGSVLGKEGFVVERVWSGGAADEGGLSESDPILVQDFKVDEDARVAALQLFLRRRKAGFLDAIIVIPVSLDSASFL